MTCAVLKTVAAETKTSTIKQVPPTIYINQQGGITACIYNNYILAGEALAGGNDTIRAVSIIFSSILRLSSTSTCKTRVLCKTVEHTFITLARHNTCLDLGLSNYLAAVLYPTMLQKKDTRPGDLRGRASILDSHTDLHAMKSALPAKSPNAPIWVSSSRR
jgi:hypothetical protein